MSQGSWSSGGGTRSGDGGDAGGGNGAADDGAADDGDTSAARSFSRRAAKYSGLRSRHDACVFFRRSAWHAGDAQTRCRSPTRGSGVNQ